MEDNQRLSSWPLFLVGALFVTGFLAVGAWNVELPYLAFSSGPVSDAADAIIAEEVEVYPPEGELLMLTIVSQDVNVFEAMIAGVDPNIDLVRRAAFRPPDETDEEYRNRVLQQMDDSQQRAVTVAINQLGYEMIPVDLFVVDLVEGLPAEGVLQIGDSIDALDGVEIRDAGDLTGSLEAYDAGDVVELTITREGSPQTVELELAERDDETGGPVIGVVVRELSEPPFPVSIEAGNVGGPSAGLMHTLAIIDTLTPGELTHGRVIAGTGTIQFDGSIGSIGGVRQKVIGAEAAGADVILVPQGNYEEAITAEHDSIEIVPVATIDEALAYLENLART